MNVIDIASQLDKCVLEALSSMNNDTFCKSYKISEAIKELNFLLTEEAMQPIMLLQNQRTGFKTDLPEGYNVDEVRKCVIDAVLLGVQITGNQFNILEGSTYITKEGFGHLLSKTQNLVYNISFSVPEIKLTEAIVPTSISWRTNDTDVYHREMSFVTRHSRREGTDAVIGRATRKARAWLYQNLNGVEISDGDVTEMTSYLEQKAKRSVLQETEMENIKVEQKK